MIPDTFVYDSQFAFLPEQEELAKTYAEANRDHRTEIVGLQAYLKHEKWDSDTFGKNFGRLLWLENKVGTDTLFASIHEHLKKFDCCYVRLNPNHSFCEHAADKLQLMSSKVSQHIDLGKHSFKKDPAGIVDFEKLGNNRDDVFSQVISLSEESFIHNRFRSDKHFSAEQVNTIYRNWIINEVKNKTSKLYLVLDNGVVASFFLYRENISPLAEYKIGFVSLIATSPAYKEKKYASVLLNTVLARAKEEGTQFAIANTESRNEGALRFFRSNGFQTTAHLNEYHIWS